MSHLSQDWKCEYLPLETAHKYVTENGKHSHYQFVFLV